MPNTDPLAAPDAPPADLLEPALDLTGRAMGEVDRLIQGQLESTVALIPTLSRHLVNSGGKRLRPMLVLLSAELCACENDQPPAMAAAIELTHSATLLHDDVVDASQRRRGRETANHIWGDQASVLVGDVLYARALRLLLGTGNQAAMNTFAETINIASEGEVLQLVHVHDSRIDEAQYRRIIYRKTAALFGCAAAFGAQAAGRPAEETQALQHYGEHLGNAFQMVDDALDYTADGQQFGKNPGDDLAAGHPTLVLIRALERAAPAQQGALRAALEGESPGFEAIMKIIASTDALAYTLHCARQEAEQAVACLPEVDSPARRALADMAAFAVARLS